MSRGGRRYGRHHLPVESCHSLSAWGYFQAAQMWDGDDTFEIEWDFQEDAAELHLIREGIKREQRIPLEWTTCNYGGQRAWFRCKCGRRVGKVYLPETMYISGNSYTGGQRVWWFACRHCFDLTYLQRRDNRDLYWTYLHRADRIEQRWLGEIEEDWINRKKGQHWHTFERRLDQYEALIEASNECGLRNFGRFLKRFGRGNLV